MKTIFILSIFSMVALASCTVTEPLESGPYTESRFIPAYGSVYDPYYNPYYNDSYYHERYARSDRYSRSGRYYSRPRYSRPSYAPTYVVPAQPAPRVIEGDVRYRRDQRQAPARYERSERVEDSRQRPPAMLNRNAPWKS